MNSKSVAPVSYEVCVCEISFSGVQSPPQLTLFIGRGARRRAIQFAEREQRSSTTSIRVYPTNGVRRGVVWSYRNERPLCPCNDPRCKSIYAAGKIVHLYSEQSTCESLKIKTIAMTACTELAGCCGDAPMLASRKCQHVPRKITLKFSPSWNV